MFGVCDDEKNALAVDEPSLQPLSFCSGNPAKCRGGARSDREPGGGARGGEAESRHFCQGRHFCTGKRDRIEGIQFLTVGIDMDKIFGF